MKLSRYFSLRLFSILALFYAATLSAAIADTSVPDADDHHASTSNQHVSTSDGDASKSATSETKFKIGLPNVHGTLRPRMEWDTEAGQYRFLIRNARLSLDGKLSPNISYFYNMALWDEGKLQILDLWGRIALPKGFAVQAGQFRMPLGLEPHIAPHKYIFANRSFIGKTMCNIRSVGVMGEWHASRFPLTVEAGIFNPTTIGDQGKWNKKLAWSARVLTGKNGFTISAGAMQLHRGIRMNLADVAMTWSDSHWNTGIEYMYKHYCNTGLKGTHGYCAYGSYGLPLRTRFFNRLSFHGRFDGMTAHSSGQAVDGLVTLSDPTRNRITAGATLSWMKSANTFLDLRIDYEQYFYHSGQAVAPGAGNKLVAELVFRF